MISILIPERALVNLLLVEDVGQVAAATVLTVRHGSHEDTGTALEGS